MPHVGIPRDLDLERCILGVCWTDSTVSVLGLGDITATFGCMPETVRMQFYDLVMWENGWEKKTFSCTIRAFLSVDKTTKIWLAARIIVGSYFEPPGVANSKLKFPPVLGVKRFTLVNFLAIYSPMQFALCSHHKPQSQVRWQCGILDSGIQYKGVWFVFGSSHASYFVNSKTTCNQIRYVCVLQVLKQEVLYLGLPLR